MDYEQGYRRADPQGASEAQFENTKRQMFGDDMYKMMSRANPRHEAMAQAAPSVMQGREHPSAPLQGMPSGQAQPNPQAPSILDQLAPEEVGQFMQFLQQGRQQPQQQSNMPVIKPDVNPPMPIQKPNPNIDYR